MTAPRRADTGASRACGNVLVPPIDVGDAQIQPLVRTGNRCLSMLDVHERKMGSHGTQAQYRFLGRSISVAYPADRALHRPRSGMIHPPAGLEQTP